MAIPPSSTSILRVDTAPNGVILPAILDDGFVDWLIESVSRLTIMGADATMLLRRDDTHPLYDLMARS